MVKILNFNCVRNFSVTTGYCVYVFFDLHLFGFSLEVSIFSIKLPCKYRQNYWCSSWILILCHYVLVVQYFCQWLHYDNLWKIRTFKEPNQPESWKTTLKDKILFSLTSKILGSYMWVFTVLQYNIQAVVSQRSYKKCHKNWKM